MQVIPTLSKTQIAALFILIAQLLWLPHEAGWTTIMLIIILGQGMLNESRLAHLLSVVTDMQEKVPDTD